MQRPCRATRRRCAGRFRLARCFQRARTSSVSNDGNNHNEQDKQVTQHQLTPKSKWRTLQPCLNFRNQNVPISGSDYRDTCVPKPGKTFLMKGICTDTLLLHCCGTDSSRGLVGQRIGECTRGEKCFLGTWADGTFVPCAWTMSKWQGKGTIWIPCGRD